MSRALELAAQLTGEWHADALSYDTALNAADELRRLAAVEAQRDELLAALKDVTEGFSILKDSDFPALGKARAAIAKATP